MTVSFPRIAIKKCEDCNRIAFGESMTKSMVIRKSGCSCDGGHWTALYWEMNEIK